MDIIPTINILPLKTNCFTFGLQSWFLSVNDLQMTDLQKLAACAPCKPKAFAVSAQ